MSDRYTPRFGFPIASWHRWFAWRPVNTLDRGWRWMRFVERRRIHMHGYLDDYGPDMWWQYAVDVQ